jgi:O-6-methylguanine DNA methyltransferase
MKKELALIRKKVKRSMATRPRPISNGVKTFREKVLGIVKKVPKGGSMTYKQVATKAGNPKAARAVGAIMRTNYDPSIPCHRVVRTDGSLGSYNRGGSTRKRELLVSEGAF